MCSSSEEMVAEETEKKSHLVQILQIHENFITNIFLILLVDRVHYHYLEKFISTCTINLHTTVFDY